MKHYPTLSERFYLSKDVVKLSQKLLGKVLVTHIDGQKVAGRIVETEAYKGPTDKASHAYGSRCTERTKTMFEAGGISYIYLCYGIHHLFNVVTAPKGIPHAVLIRALEPLEGVKTMGKRRNMTELKSLSSGPGKLSKALGLSREFDAVSLQSSTLWIEDRGLNPKSNEVVATARVGIDYAEEHKDLPWRFYIKDNPFISQP